MSDTPRSADALVDQLLNVPGMLDQVRSYPEETLRALAKQVTQNLPRPAIVSDAWTYRIVVIALGTVCVAAIAGGIYLSAIVPPDGKSNIPDVLTALGAAAIGAMAGLLAPSPAGK